MSNPNSNPPPIVGDPKKLLKKLKSPIPESATQKLERTTSFPESLFTVENHSFDIQFELSLFRSKLESFLSEVVIDPIQFYSHLLSSKYLFSKVDHELWVNFDKIQSLAHQLQITTEKYYIQYQLENLAIASSSTAPVNTSTTSSVIVNLTLPPLDSSYLSKQPIVVPLLHPPIVMA